MKNIKEKISAIDWRNISKEMETTNGKFAEAAKIYLRLALATAYLSSVASRFGLWGEGTGWVNFQDFLEYTAKLNPFLPASFIPFVGWTATVAETLFAVLLVIGFRIKETAFSSGIVLILFAVGMTLGFGFKAPLDYSVYTASAASFLLAVYHHSPFSLDALLGESIN